MSGFSSYIVNKGPKKPNLVAPGENVNVTPFGLLDGTSISAALTTGCIALLMECEPSLKLHPERIIALLSASAATFSNTTFGTFDNESGVGILDLDKAIKNKYKALFRYNTSTSYISTSFTIDLQKDDQLRVALAWLAKANGKENGTSFTDYNLKVYNSSNQVVATSSFSDNNVEFIEINIPSTGQYKIEMYQNSTKVQDDNVALYYIVN